MSCERIGVLEKPGKIGFRLFLQWDNGGALEPQIPRNPDQPPEGNFANEKTHSFAPCECRTVVGLRAIPFGGKKVLGAKSH
jgi:hypothetical protein